MPVLGFRGWLRCKILLDFLLSQVFHKIENLSNVDKLYIQGFTIKIAVSEEMETELAEKKKALREAKYAGLRTAMQARKEADDAIKQELKDLGYQATSFGIPLSSSYHWKF